MWGVSSSHEVYVQEEYEFRCCTCKKKIKKPSELEYTEDKCMSCMLRDDRFIQNEDTFWDRMVDWWLN